MLSRVSSRWGDDDELEGEGRVQADAQQHSLAHAGNWALATLDKTRTLAEQQRLEAERAAAEAAARVAAEAERAARDAALERSYARTFQGAGTDHANTIPDALEEGRAAEKARADEWWYAVGQSAIQEAISAPRSTALEPPLSPEQADVLQMVVQEEKSLMFTGGAGTGKSVLVRAIVKELIRKHGASRVGVTATTGIAALHIGGRTLHSWTGLGLGNGSVKDLVAVLTRGSKEKRERWRQTRVLVIDEVSMLDAVFFDKLEAVARSVRHSELPFGGIQLVLVGDFYQLPPVVTNMTNWGTDRADLRAAKKEHEETLAAYKSRFLFDAFTWHSCVPIVVILKTVFRQSDSKFVQMLEELRRDRLTLETIRAFTQLARPLPIADGILPTELYPTRAEVSNSNETRLMALRTHREIYAATDRSRVHSKFGAMSDIHAWLDKATMFPYHLELREKAQVMLLKNCNGELVNGSRGIIVGFLTYKKLPHLVRRSHGRVFYPRHQQVSDTYGSQPAATSRTVKPDPASHVDKKPKIAKDEFDEFDEFDDPDMDAAMAHTALDAPTPSSSSSLPQHAPLPARNFHRTQSQGSRSHAATLMQDLASEAASQPRSAARGKFKPQGRLAAGRPLDRSVGVTIVPPGSGATTASSSPGQKRAAEAPPTDVNSSWAELNRLYVEVAQPSSSANSNTVGGLDHAEEGKAYPIVRFVNGHEYLITPQEHRVEDHLGREEGGRVQVPLALAWSISIHKAQGMTLDKCSIDLAKAFERGQAYVALSRATDLKALQVKGFHPSKVQTDPLVLQWEEGVLAAQVELQRERQALREAERRQAAAMAKGAQEDPRRPPGSMTLTVKDNTST